MKHIILLLLLCTCCLGAAGQKYDLNWPTGYKEYPGLPGYGNAMIRFQDTGAYATPAVLPFNFESTVAAMSDVHGKLLFYSNGCQVANGNNEVMPNGNGLNPGSLSAQVCPWKGYTIPQGALTLPKPGDTSKYYMIHIAGNYDPERKLILTRLQYSTVDMNLDGGLGDVVEKNIILLMGDFGSFTAVRHGNGRDWWLIVPDFGNARWHKILVTPTGFEIFPPQDVSISPHGCEHHAGTAMSSDGSKLANWGDCKVVVLNFDRCSGAFYSPLELAAPTHWIQGGGVAFSPSGRYLYATSQNVLFRADLQSPHPKLDTMRYSLDPYLQSPYDVPGNTFHYLVNAPNGNIYGNIPSRSKFLHVLKNADGPTINDINFVPQGLPLPVKGVRTLPNIPNYHLYNLVGTLCDTLGITAVHNASIKFSTLQVAPNPNAGIFEVSLPEGDFQHLTVFNLAGQQVISQPIEKGMRNIQIALRNAPPGMYWIELVSKDGSNRYRSKIAVM
jgi:hypothetical protein